MTNCRFFWRFPINPHLVWNVVEKNFTSSVNCVLFKTSVTSSTRTALLGFLTLVSSEYEKIHLSINNHVVAYSIIRRNLLFAQYRHQLLFCLELYQLCCEWEILDFFLQTSRYIIPFETYLWFQFSYSCLLLQMYFRLSWNAKKNGWNSLSMYWFWLCIRLWLW